MDALTTVVVHPSVVRAHEGVVAHLAEGERGALPAKLRVFPELFVNARVVLCTCPDQDTAARLARSLVDEFRTGSYRKDR